MSEVIKNGCYHVEYAVNDDGSVTLATLCPSQRVLGHYVRISPEQAAQLCRFLCDNVPGVAGTLTEV